MGARSRRACPARTRRPRRASASRRGRTQPRSINLALKSSNPSCGLTVPRSLRGRAWDRSTIRSITPSRNRAHGLRPPASCGDRKTGFPVAHTSASVVSPRPAITKRSAASTSADQGRSSSLCSGVSLCTKAALPRPRKQPSKIDARVRRLAETSTEAPSDSALSLTSRPRATADSSSSPRRAVPLPKRNTTF